MTGQEITVGKLLARIYDKIILLTVIFRCWFGFGQSSEINTLHVLINRYSYIGY